MANGTEVPSQKPQASDLARAGFQVHPGSVPYPRHTGYSPDAHRIHKLDNFRPLAHAIQRNLLFTNDYAHEPFVQAGTYLRDAGTSWINELLGNSRQTSRKARGCIKPAQINMGV